MASILCSSNSMQVSSKLAIKGPKHHHSHNGIIDLSQIQMKFNYLNIPLVTPLLINTKGIYSKVYTGVRFYVCIESRRGSRYLVSLKTVYKFFYWRKYKRVMAILFFSIFEKRLRGSDCHKVAIIFFRLQIKN